MKDCDPACSTGDSSLATAPPDAPTPPPAEAQCVCWMCSVNEDSVKNPMEHWLQKKAWFPSGIGKLNYTVSVPQITYYYKY